MNSSLLFLVSIIVYLSALLSALWLGLYLVTRNPRRPEAWLAAVTAWSMSGLFLNMLFALHPPTLPDTPTFWGQLLLLFWPPEILQENPEAWLRGWSSTISSVFWYHATLCMRVNRWQLRHTLAVAAGYAAGVFGIGLQMLLPQSYQTIAGDPLFLTVLHGSPVYGLFLAGLMLVTALSIRNLHLTAERRPHELPRRQFWWLSAATLLAGLSGPLGLATAFLQVPTPMFVIALLIGGSLLVTGYSIARYSALLQSRVFMKDFASSAVTTAIATLFCLGVTWSINQLYPFSPAVYALVGAVAVVGSSFIDTSRQQLDWRAQQQEKRQQRQRQRTLEQNSLQAVESPELRPQSLERALALICSPLEAEYALLLERQDGAYRRLAGHGPAAARLPEEAQRLESFNADDLKILKPGALPPPLHSAAALLPLYRADQQIGALVLGPARHGMAYSALELENLHEFHDYLAAQSGSDTQTPTQAVAVAALPISAPENPWPCQSEAVSSRAVESGLRNLHNYARLAETPLAELRCVAERARALAQSSNSPAALAGPSQLEIGKAIHLLLCELIECLRPPDGSEQVRLHGAPRRDWYPYIILRDAYLHCQPNREIMDRLYVSEGTFNRTRRSAIQSLTCILNDREQAN